MFRGRRCEGEVSKGFLPQIGCVEWKENLYYKIYMCNAVVTHLRKAASYEPGIAILGIWGDTWLTRGKYGIYVTVRGNYGALTGST